MTRPTCCKGRIPDNSQICMQVGDENNPEETLIQVQNTFCPSEMVPLFMLLPKRGQFQEASKMPHFFFLSCKLGWEVFLNLLQWIFIPLRLQGTFCFQLF